MLPVAALFADNRQPERVMDVAAAPGSKTTQIAARMGNAGGILANEFSASRVKVLHANISRVGLAGLAKTPIEALSGGQFQRMLFARVMVQQAPLVMLDEPFTGIDEATSRELMDLILEMHRQGQTILAVLHDNQRVADFFPETLLLTSQRACWGVTRAVLPAFSHARSA